MSFTEPRYVIWPEQYSTTILKALLKDIKRTNGEIENSNNHVSGRKKSKSKWFQNKDLMHLDTFKDVLWRMGVANKTSFGFNLYETIFGECLYNKYEAPDGNYDWHLDDSLKDSGDVKLTGILNLSTKKYTGGQFQMTTGEVEDIPLTPGTLLLFRSNTFHRVLPIETGVRETLTFFFEGPRLI
mgnify:CR=1 FL=1|tara:strand:- start:104 stop:655 length:552 start_codon:yes stop_codon:yes gene_type:complete